MGKNNLYIDYIKSLFNFRKTEGHDRIIQIFRSLSMLLISTILIFGLASCASQYNYVPIPTTTEKSPEPGSSNETSKGKSAPIRVWWSSRQTLNPLLDSSLTGKAANDLIFDGLIEKNETGKLIYNLADSVTWSDAGFSMTIELKSDTRFHDGSSVSATDAAICLAYVWSENGGPEFDPAFYLESTEETPNDSQETDPIETDINDDEDETDNEVDPDVSEDSDDSDDSDDKVNDYPKKPHPDELFSSLYQIDIINEHKLVCRFEEQQSEFVSLLTFPIIPAESWFLENQMSLIDGTGPYEMQKIDSEGSLWLSYVNDDNQENETNSVADTIILKQYKRVNEAMQALESDELDVVLLDSDQYPYYFTRNNLTLQRFTSNRSVFIAIQTKTGILSDPKKMIELKKQFNSLSIQRSELSIPGEINDLPLSIKMLPIENSENLYKEELNIILYELNEDSDNLKGEKEESNQIELTPLTFIVPDQEYLVSIAKKISESAEIEGFSLSLNILNNMDYADALESGSYNLALCEAILNDDLNPAWLYGPNGSVREIEWLPSDAISGYDSARLRLSWYDDTWYLPKQIDNDQETATAESNIEYGRVLTEVAARSPFAHLYLPYSALAYGDRVQGSSKPSLFHPYRGLEELWIWSGQ